MEKPLCRRRWYPRGFLSSVLALAFSAWRPRPLANIALGAGACVIAYALCVPAFLRIKQTA